jgi:hypothetical protein
MTASKQFIHDTSVATNFFNGSQRIYSALTSVFNKLAILTIGFPIIMFLWGVLYYLRNRIIKASNFSKITLNYNNYKDLRVQYDTLSGLLSELPNTDKLKQSLHNIPFVFRGIAKEVIFIKDAMIDRHNAIDGVLKSLNKINTSKSKGLLTPVSEDDLWQNRTKVYDYLV